MLAHSNVNFLTQLSLTSVCSYITIARESTIRSFHTLYIPLALGYTIVMIVSPSRSLAPSSRINARIPHLLQIVKLMMALASKEFIFELSVHLRTLRGLYEAQHVDPLDNAGLIFSDSFEG